MGYRGSKLIVLFKSTAIVKEQWLYGSYHINFMQLRYNLTGFERNYQIRNLSNQIDIEERIFLFSKVKQYSSSAAV